MRKLLLSGIAASVIGGAAMLSVSAPVSAATLPSFALATPGDTAGVEEVQYRQYRKRDRRARRYDRRHHGPRYRYARPGFRHHFGGHYYSSPWWGGVGFGFAIPGVALGLSPGYGGGYGGSSGHVEWCMDRYRTYDPRTDMYIPRVGEWAYCNSPFN